MNIVACCSMWRKMSKTEQHTLNIWLERCALVLLIIIKIIITVNAFVCFNLVILFFSRSFVGHTNALDTQTQKLILSRLHHFIVKVSVTKRNWLCLNKAALHRFILALNEGASRSPRSAPTSMCLMY